MSVAKKIIQMSLSSSSIGNAIKQLRAYRNSLDKKKEKLLKRLGDIGLREAQVRFANAIYDGARDITVTLNPTNNGYCIVADGKAAVFIEFGAGVYYNPSEPYPNPRPAGVVGIGEYGYGRGKRKAWGYEDENGELVITHGNPAAMPMWYASEELRSNILKIAKEVLG